MLHKKVFVFGARVFKAAPIIAMSVLISTASPQAQANQEADQFQKKISSLQHSGDSEQAVALAKQYVGVTQQKFGAEHKNTSAAYHVFGVALFMDGQYTEAEKMLKMALKIDERIFGPNHPDIVRHLESLATVYYALVRFEDADRIKERANKINQN